MNKEDPVPSMSINDQIRRTVMSHSMRRLREIDDSDLDLCVSYYTLSSRVSAKASSKAASPKALEKNALSSQNGAHEGESLPPAGSREAKVSQLAAELCRMGDEVYGLTMSALCTDDLCVVGHILKLEKATDHLKYVVEEMREVERLAAVAAAAVLSSMPAEDGHSIPIGQMIEGSQTKLVTPVPATKPKKSPKRLTKDQIANELDSYHYSIAPLVKNRRATTVFIEEPTSAQKKVGKSAKATKSKHEVMGIDVTIPDKSPCIVAEPPEKKPRKEKLSGAKTIVPTVVAAPTLWSKPEASSSVAQKPPGQFLASLGLVMGEDGIAVPVPKQSPPSPFSFSFGGGGFDDFAGPLSEEDSDDNATTSSGQDLSVVGGNTFSFAKNETVVSVPTVQVIEIYQCDAADFLHKQVRLHGTLSVDKGATLLIEKNFQFNSVDANGVATADIVDPRKMKSSDEGRLKSLARNFVISAFKAFHKKDTFYFHHNMAYI